MKRDCYLFSQKPKFSYQLIIIGYWWFYIDLVIILKLMTNKLNVATPITLTNSQITNNHFKSERQWRKTSQVM